ncbi:hypothetical protein BEL04_05115 [Mucilaginibacter sp. PPCGB 2223]|uniref:hypothetical protein n=1 Tax=Mucilaginibacter sp. PPCGB 2223 TaxID=1886027 RepID=UPI000825886A|nr:hypothetical protein [Mucilaginibacter sp. PPCGB 2223]OCX53677.1 hypothetical protein BEL04_05115 [Mucilaginibacter sp. PPCGB 2223]
MKTKVKSSLKLILPVLLAALCLQATAQKKDVQPANLRAPEGIKIDGKLAEWGYDLQAYNKTTKIYYTMANDDKNLYLVVKVKDKIDITKTLGGGISLTINTADKKKDKDAFVITFPMPPPRASGGRNAMRGMRGGFGGFGANQSQTQAQIDSASRATHKTALGLIREIGILGFKDITDSTISIYNEYGIKAAAGFDDEDAFVSELSIPLKLLALNADDPKEFAYNIKANGINSGNNRNRGEGDNGGDGGFNGGGFGGGRNGGGGGGFGGGGAGGFGGGGRNGGGGGRNGGGGANNMISMMEELTTATDFWGKYTLAKPANK